ncbi:type II toxin-antitoxin system VapC family toxin [Blastococcus xanthinilyticus]|uniref:Ribonuclease VapC n=1 Tax=Blastococcus xanthinilyticus TaxID=1564164 RepID=A0A5S5D4B3_9ACTN|nr:type II toxin-antitoxin system VapC family toxin [Blastococcus xanthinilyticus]TYP90781.1 putative nucleic acid-binding protein [Blastococcus xanthinilyticus]
MIVLDASVVVTGLLIGDPVGNAAREVLRLGPLHAPHLLDVEATSAIRRWVLSGRLTAEDARMSLRDLQDLAVDRHAHEPLLDRVLELRDAVSAYDAVYVALAELLGARLVTGDHRLARASGVRCPIDLVG